MNAQVSSEAHPSVLRTDRLRRTGLAIALFTAPWGLLIGNATYAWITRNGGSDLTGRDALALAMAHPTSYRFATVATLLGSALMVPAALGAMRAIGSRLTRPALVGGVVLAAGYICYFGAVLSNTTTLAMAARGGPTDDYVAVLDTSISHPSTVGVYVVFILGNLIGTLVIGIALLRSRVVPVWGAVGVIAWAPFHVIGLVIGSEWFEVVGALLQAVGFATVGAALLGRWGRDTTPPGARLPKSPVLTQR
jgi:hypothetical protein